MNTSPVFDEIVATCTLVGMRGVIPSLMEYQYQLKQRIERFCGDLQKKHYHDDAIDALCRLTCLVVDLNTRHCLEQQEMSWHGYELEHVFYGFSSDPLFTEQHAVLLFKGKNDELAHYARLLFALSPRPLAGRTVAQAHPHLPALADTPKSSQPARIEEAAKNVAEAVVETPALHQSFYAPLIKQLLGAGLLLVALWSVCWYYLQEGI